MPKNPNSHHKPTPEEIQAKIDEALEIPDEELEKPNPDEKEEEDDTPEENEEENNDENAEVDDESGEEGEEREEEDTKDEDEEDQAEPSKELYKKKFSASSRENQRINAKNRVINQALTEAEEIPVPTDDEMKGIYGEDWEIASDIEKESLRETQISKRWRAKIKEATDQATKIEKWAESVDEFIDDPKTLNDYPDLEGNTDEFKEYASSAESNNVPFNILVPAFLHSKSINKESHKGQMFERAKGGSKEKPKVKNGMLTLEEARVLRETNYSKWKEMLEKGKIQMDI